MKRKKSIKTLVESYQPGTERISEYCERHGFTPSSFYYWRKRLQVEEATSFVSIYPIMEQVQSIHLRLPSGVEVHLPEMTRSELVKWALEFDQAYAEL
jgi:transposase-like protein